MGTYGVPKAYHLLPLGLLNIICPLHVPAQVSFDTPRLFLFLPSGGHVNAVSLGMFVWIYSDDMTDELPVAPGEMLADTADVSPVSDLFV